MERERRSPSGTTSSEDTVFVRLVAKWLPKDSPEFQERANRPLSERGPHLAHPEQQKPTGDQPPSN